MHIEVDEGQQDIPHAARFRWDIYERLEEQKIDLVFHVRGRPLRFIDEIAMTEGVVL